jgi:hypothetical protein
VSIDECGLPKGRAPPPAERSLEPAREAVMSLAEDGFDPLTYGSSCSVLRPSREKRRCAPKGASWIAGPGFEPGASGL